GREGNAGMTGSIVLGVSILARVAAAAPAHAGERVAQGTSALPGAAPPPNSTEDDCEARIRKLDASDAEGEERLAEKNEVIDYCATQYENDKTIDGLVDECAKYEEQPVVKRQFVAECQLAAYKYANALRALKEEYWK